MRKVYIARLRKPAALLSVASSLKQFGRFASVGCLSFAISTVVFYLCYRQWHLGTALLGGPDSDNDVRMALASIGVSSLDGAVASVFGYVAGMANSFLLNRSWTFRAEKQRINIQIQRFILVNIIGLALSTAIIFVSVDIMQWPYMVMWVVAVGIVTGLNFAGNKYWTFTHLLERPMSRG